MAIPDEWSAPVAHAPGHGALNGAAAVHPLAPGPYPWAAAHYRAACAHHWWPEDVPLARDVVQWQSGAMTETEQAMVRHSVAALAAASGAVSRLALSLHRLLKAPQCRHFLLRQAFEASLHLVACQRLAAAFGGDTDARWRDAGEDAATAAFVQVHIEPVTRRDFHTGTAADDQKLLKALALHACLRDGLAFFAGCAWILALGRQQRLTGLARLYQYVLRDKELHGRFMLDLFNQIRTEHPQLWTPAFREELRGLQRCGAELEIARAERVQPQAAAGLQPALIGDYLRCQADRRLRRIGLDPLWPDAPDPFPWMAQAADLPAPTEAARPAVRQFGGLLSWE